MSFVRSLFVVFANVFLSYRLHSNECFLSFQLRKYVPGPAHTAVRLILIFCLNFSQEKNDAAAFCHTRHHQAQQRWEGTGDFARCSAIIQYVTHCAVLGDERQPGPRHSQSCSVKFLRAICCAEFRFDA